MLISGPILREYEDVLSRPRLGIPSELAVSAIQRISTIAEFVTQKSRLELLDSDDAMFLECALDGQADYLITGNKRHYPNWTIVVSPREFLERTAG